MRETSERNAVAETPKIDGFPEDASDALRERWGRYGLTHIPYRLLMLARMIDRASSIASLPGISLPLAEWRVVANLSLLGDTTVSEIAESALVDRAEVSRAAHALEQRGLIRLGAHPGSKAKKLLTLTEAGRALAEDLGVQRRGFYAHLLEGLDEAQRRQFDAMLLHLAVRLEQYEAPGGAVPV